MSDIHIDGRIDWNRLVPFGIFAAGVSTLAVAYTAEYAFGIEPCPLCLYQRIPYALAGVLGLAAFVMTKGRYRTSAVNAAGVLFLIGAAIAFYHVGVEQHWWASAVCEASGGEGPTSVEELRRMLMAAKPAKACDEVDWTLFGISMATYNVPMSLALAVASFWGAALMRRTP